MTNDEFKLTWDVLLSVARTAQFIPIEDVYELLETANMADAIGPMIDPTKYRDGGMNNLDDQREIAKGFLAFRKAIDKVMARAKPTVRP